MQRQSGRLTIHTSMGQSADAPEKKPVKARWRVIPKFETRWRGTGRRKAKTPGARVKKRRTAGEKLLRNTAIACALLISVMGVSRIGQPWSDRVAQTVSGAVNMRINLDETLGRLNFVRNLLPDTALVFWNMGEEGALARPVSGVLTHEYEEKQPWLLYQVSGAQPVTAAADGTVAALTENAQGEWTMLIDHEGGEQTVYAYMDKALAATGQAVVRGDQIGVTADDPAGRLYFELRVNGAPGNPLDRLS